jgi:hypothetical protein
MSGCSFADLTPLIVIAVLDSAKVGKHEPIDMKLTFPGQHGLRMPLKNPGNQTQLGGEVRSCPLRWRGSHALAQFVFDMTEGELTCVFAHRMTNTRNHALVSPTGCVPLTVPPALSRTSFTQPMSISGCRSRFWKSNNGWPVVTVAHGMRCSAIWGTSRQFYNLDGMGPSPKTTSSSSTLMLKSMPFRGSRLANCNNNELGSK